MPESDEHADTRRRARPWRRLAILGGFLLAASCFLPAIRSCNSDLIPAEGLAELVSETQRQWPSPPDFEFVILLCAFLPAYLAGAILAAAAAARAWGYRSWNRWLQSFLLIVTAGTAVALPSAFGWAAVREGIPAAPGEWVVWLVYVVGPAIVLMYLFLARKAFDRLTLGSTFICTLWAFCWFGGWMLLEFDSTRYGLWLSFAGSAVLLIAVMGEARALSGQTWRRTLALLLIARPPRSREFRGHCPRCDYLLYGLSEMRCPECGRPFTPEEVGLPACHSS